MPFSDKPSSANKGFTLIELSIVLVIIGLIVGGVLVGQDLIKAAQVRATIGQFEKFDAAANTFRTKYDGLPGDLRNCANFFVAASCPTGGAAALVAGDGVLTDYAGTRVQLTGEVAAFFNHLYKANMIAEPMSNTTGIAATTAPVFASAFPSAKIGAGNYIIVYTGGSAILYPGMAGSSLFRLTGISDIDDNDSPVFANSLTPLEAFAIDAKKDDGVPNSGVVQGTDDDDKTHFNLATDIADTGYGSGACLSSATAYNTVTAPNVRQCQLVLRSSF